MDKKPNIILFLTDDHGQWASGAYGNRNVHTPSLDFLANNGALMENAFTPTPVCSPGRACLLTGRISSQHGLHDYLGSGSSNNIDAYPWMDAEKLLSEILHKDSYTTAMCGKWHLGNESHPKGGFDYTFSLGTKYPMDHGGTREFYENGKPITISGFKTQIITDKALGFIRKSRTEKDKPFFLNVGYTATHSPWEGQPARLVNLYRDINLDVSFQSTNYPFGIQNLESTLESRSEPKEALAQYYAAVTHIDECVGQILDELKANALDNETLIIYTSDHGLNCGHHGIWGKGNGTLPLNMVEESVRVPLILHYPGQIMSPQRRAEFVDHTDLFQTILDFTGVKLDKQLIDAKNYPGRSYYHTLVNDLPLDNWKQYQCCEYGDVRMVCNHRYKLVHRYPNGPNHFFDLRHDPGEVINLYGDEKFRVIIDKMTNAMDEYYAKYADKDKNGLNVKNLPRHNATESWRDPRNLH